MIWGFKHVDVFCSPIFTLGSSRLSLLYLSSDAVCADTIKTQKDLMHKAPFPSRCVYHRPRIPPTWRCERVHTAPERTAVWYHHSVTGLCSPESPESWKVALPPLHPASVASPLALQGQKSDSGHKLTTPNEHNKDKTFVNSLAGWSSSRCCTSEMSFPCLEFPAPINVEVIINE